MKKKESVCVCVCVCVCEKESVCAYEKERKYVCVCEKERKCVCVCEREREREKTIVCFRPLNIIWIINYHCRFRKPVAINIDFTVIY